MDAFHREKFPGSFRGKRQEYRNEGAMKMKYRSICIWFCLLVVAGAGCQSQAAPVNGAPGIGDPYFPDLGNGGYDVQNYAISLDVDPAANTLNGSTTIGAIPTARLRSFNLDFHALTIDSVLVDNVPAEFSRDGNELTVRPSRVLEIKIPFSVMIQYHGTPELVTAEAIPLRMGWSHAADGTINVWGEPVAASSWFPNNNHPRDKASYRFEISVPESWVVAATGTLKETKESADKTVFIWEMGQPMASYLASINIDRYELFTQAGPNGVTIRNYFPPEYPASLRGNFDIIPAALSFFSDLFGPYPFEEYGVVISDTTAPCDFGSTALEAQSLSIHCPSSSMASEYVIAHELAHQWFGDSVSLENWKDIWLKEGLATYAGWLWESKNDSATLARIARQERANFSDSGASVAEPPPKNLYSRESYTGGALVFHALRLEVGEDVFFSILKTYAERYRYGVAGTDEFIAIAQRVSDENLQQFFDDWLFSPRLPD
jgi:aminopeptidase N